MVANEESLRDRQRAQIRADIRRAAFPLFAERGYDTVTTEEIAAAPGIRSDGRKRRVAARPPTRPDPRRHPPRGVSAVRRAWLRHRDHRGDRRRRRYPI